MNENNNDILQNTVSHDRYEVAIPSDARNDSKYKSYSVRLFTAVPANAKLICSNKITGKYSIKDSGFRFNLPWISSRLITTSTITADYKAQDITHSDGRVKVDVVVNYQIIDPIKYVTGSADVVQQMFNQVNNIVRVYVANVVDLSDLFGKKIRIEEFNNPQVNRENNSNDSDNNNNNSNDTFEEYREFSLENGIKLKSITIDQIVLSDRIQKSFEEVKAAKLKVQESKIIAQGKLDIAKTLAEKDKVLGAAKAEVEAAMIGAKIAKLKEYGLSEKEIRDVLVTDGNASIIATLGETNNQTASTMAAIQGAEEIKNKRKILK